MDTEEMYILENLKHRQLHESITEKQIQRIIIDLKRVTELPGKQ